MFNYSARCCRKVPELGKQRNAGLTYQFWLPSPSKLSPSEHIQEREQDGQEQELGLEMLNVR
jgi:hypothetical protein